MCPPTYWSVKCFFVNLYSERDWKACLRVWGAPKSTNFFSRVIVYIGSRYRARILKLNVENDWEFNVHHHPNFLAQHQISGWRKLVSLAWPELTPEAGKETGQCTILAFMGLKKFECEPRVFGNIPSFSTHGMLKGELILEIGFPHLWLSLLGPGPQTRVERGSWCRRVAVL